MKKQIVLLAFFGLAALPAFAYRVKLNNETVTATNGCKFSVNGWVDVGCCPSINHYNVTMSGPCGTFTFSGLMVDPTNGNPWPEEAEPTNAYSMTLVDQSSGEKVPTETQGIDGTLPQLLELALNPSH